MYGATRIPCQLSHIACHGSTPWRADRKLLCAQTIVMSISYSHNPLFDKHIWLVSGSLMSCIISIDAYAVTINRTHRRRDIPAPVQGAARKRPLDWLVRHQLVWHYAHGIRSRWTNCRNAIFCYFVVLAVAHAVLLRICLEPAAHRPGDACFAAEGKLGRIGS